MITTIFVAVLAFSIGLRAIGFAMRCLGGALRVGMSLMGILLMPLCLVCTIAWGLGRILLPVLVVLFVLELLAPARA